jgi:hypothetical protein
MATSLTNSRANLASADDVDDVARKDLAGEASLLVTRLQRTIEALTQSLQESARLVAALETINEAFTSAADRLGNATCRAAIETTQGKPAAAVAASFVVELGDLANLTLRGSHDLRHELSGAKRSRAAALASLQEATSEMGRLSSVLAELALEAPAATAVRAPIVVESRLLADHSFAEHSPEASVDSSSSQVASESWTMTRRRFTN